MGKGKLVVQEYKDKRKDAVHNLDEGLSEKRGSDGRA
jgi:hypothetical protein